MEQTTTEETTQQAVKPEAQIEAPIQKEESFLQRAMREGFPTYYTACDAGDMKNPEEEWLTIGFKEVHGDKRFQIMVSMPKDKWLLLAAALGREYATRK